MSEETNSIALAMSIIHTAMNEDHEPGSYYHSWLANLSCAIYDAVNSEPYNFGTEENPNWLGEPLDPTKMEDCNKIAARFLNMLFPKKDD